MTIGLDYSGLTTALTSLLVYPLVSASSATPSSDPNFNNILPAIVNDAEQRIYDRLRPRGDVRISVIYRTIYRRWPSNSTAWPTI